MAGESDRQGVGRAPLLGHLALAAAVLLGGMTMTAGWIALFFVGSEEPENSEPSVGFSVTSPSSVSAT